MVIPHYKDVCINSIKVEKASKQKKTKSVSVINDFSDLLFTEFYFLSTQCEAFVVAMTIKPSAFLSRKNL